MTPPCGHAETHPGCPLCDLARRDRRYYDLWSGRHQQPAWPAVVAVSPREIRDACADREREIPSGEVAAMGLDVRRRWWRCRTGTHRAHSCGGVVHVA